MISLLADTSVLIKWFHSAGETEVDAAQALLRSHRAELVDVRIIDLTVYEFANVLLVKSGKSATEAAERLEDLLLLCGPPLVLEAAWRRRAFELADLHRLTLYDAAYAAAAQGLAISLVSADRQLRASGLAESVSEWVERMKLSP